MAAVRYPREHSTTQFYNLCLNPRAEVREDKLYDMVLRSSFLVWIDEFVKSLAILSRSHATALPDSVKPLIPLC